MSTKQMGLSPTPRQAGNKKSRPGAQTLFRDTRASPAAKFLDHALARDKFPKYTMAYRRCPPLGRPLVIAICCAVLAPIVGIGAFEILSSSRGEDKIGSVSQNKFVTDSGQSGGLSPLGKAYSKRLWENVPLSEADKRLSEIAAGNRETDVSFARSGKM